MKIVGLLAATATIAPLVAGPATANVPAPKSDYRVTYDAKRDRYCVAARRPEMATATRLPLIECKSSEQWAMLGLTITRR